MEIKYSMFENNKYTKWYYNIVIRAQARQSISGPFDKHHILPKSLGGSNDACNIVCLTLREHFVCHLLLTKMVTGDTARRKMAYAAWQQSRSYKFHGKVTSKIYEVLRTRLSETYTGRKRAPFSDEWRSNMKKAAKTRKKVEYSAERREKLAAIARSQKGQPLSAEHRANISQAMAGKNYEERYGSETAARMKKARRDKQLAAPLVTCPHCGKTGKGSGMHTWHFSKCRYRNADTACSTSQC